MLVLFQKLHIVTCDQQKFFSDQSPFRDPGPNWPFQSGGAKTTPAYYQFIVDSSYKHRLQIYNRLAI